MQLVPINEMQTMAEAIAQSGLFGIKTPTQALALGLLCQAEGRHPAEAARDYHIIQGRPTLKADAMLARFQQAGGRVEWTRYDDQAVVGVFTHPSGGKLTLEWTMERAKTAGLAGKEVWKQYPRNMLRSRVIAEAIRTVYPGVLSGCYLEDEIEPVQATSIQIPVQSQTADAGKITLEMKSLPAPTFPTSEWQEAIHAADSIDSLRTVFMDAIKNAQEHGNQTDINLITTAKNAKKTELSND
jgi:hypothetical protein